MLSGATPFKIHDENSGVGVVTGKSKLGLGTAKKKGLMGAEGVTSKTPLLSKSTRKALGAISVNKQGGVREDAPLSEKMGSSRLTFATGPLPTAALASSKKRSGNLSDVSNMLCSQVRKDEDVFDMTIKKASEIMTVVVPSTSIEISTLSSQNENENENYSNWEALASEEEQAVDLDCAPLSLGGAKDDSYAFSLPSTEDW